MFLQIRGGEGKPEYEEGKSKGEREKKRSLWF